MIAWLKSKSEDQALQIMIPSALKFLVLPLLLCLSSCADLSYYWQSVEGHVSLMKAARPVDDWLADAQTPEKLKAKLALTQKIRMFAAQELKLPDNASYKRYADLKRKAVVWNVVAAPALSLKLKTWCFPVAGCVGYRGYFSEVEAKKEAEELKKKDLDVSVYGVPAYSTLGWSNWAGGDPLLSTFIGYPDGELARIIFHELAHQVVYVADDTTFNESFATAVERLGGARWLAMYGSEAIKAEYDVYDGRRKQFKALTKATRLQLAEIYNENKPIASDNIDSIAIKNIAKKDKKITEKESFEAKNNIIASFKAQYESLKTSWNGYAGYDNWVKQANNAAFGALAAYDDGVPQFEALFEQQGGDWEKFYAAVRALAAMPKEARQLALKSIKVK
jgi:predicted aminopeptidase